MWAKGEAAFAATLTQAGKLSNGILFGAGAYSDAERKLYLLAKAPIMEWKIFIPSVPPSSGPDALSGCGIMPTTLPPALQMPAILPSEPLGLADGETPPVGVT